MSDTHITERQHYWRDHVLAVTAFDGSIVDYANANNLKTKDIYQWKTSLTKHGFLSLDNAPANDFVAVQPIDLNASDDQKQVTCRLTLACGAALELFTPVDSADIPQLLSAIPRN